mmetsp:Transcript_9507/g.22177  ORF Transcript_9507/g.22177 Transcript_9507/m.22177 type:complete len:82 (+) Transcript_9507:458-703(+)
MHQRDQLPRQSKGQRGWPILKIRMPLNPKSGRDLQNCKCRAVRQKHILARAGQASQRFAASKPEHDPYRLKDTRRRRPMQI